MAFVMNIPGAAYATDLPRNRSASGSQAKKLSANFITANGVQEVGCFFTITPDVNAAVMQAVLRMPTDKAIAQEDFSMKTFLSVDRHDLAVMIGSSSLAGAIANTLLSASPLNDPHYVVMTIAALGFLFGKVASSRLKRVQHG